MCPVKFLGETGQEASSRDGATPATANVGHVGKRAFQQFLVVIPEWHVPCAIVGIIASIEQFPSQCILVGEQAGCYIAKSDDTGPR